MERIIAIIFITLNLSILTSFTNSTSNIFITNSHHITKENPKCNVIQPENSENELSSDIILSLLNPYTQKAVDNFYCKYLMDLPGADPNFDKILSFKRISEESNFEYLIEIETAPYVGPHITVGVDHITFGISAIGEVSLEKFEHIESHSLPMNYNQIIKSWPPR